MSNKSRGFGIKGKLFLAFGAIAGGAVVSGIVASLILQELGGNVREMADRRIPEISLALQLHAETGTLAAGAPALLRAESESQRSDYWAALENQQKVVNAKLGELGATLGDDPALKTIAGLSGELTGHLSKLHDAVGDRMMVIDQRVEAAKSNLRALDRLRGLVAKGLDGVQGNISQATMSMGSDASTMTMAMIELVTTHVPLAQALAELRGQANQAAEMLARASFAPNENAVAAGQKAFSIAAEKAREHLEVIETLHPTDGLKAALEAVLIRGVGKNSLFGLRSREMEAMRASRAIMDQAQATTVALAKAVDGLVDMANRQTKAATDESEAFIRTGMAVVLAIAAACVAAALLIVFLYIARSLVRRITRLEAVMGRLAEGDLTVDVPAGRQRDEVDRMGETVAVFKRNALAAERMRAEQDADNRTKAERAARMETLVRNFETQLGQLVGEVTVASSELGSTASVMSGIASQTTSQTAVVSNAASEASVNVGTVATAAEELAASISEIARQVGVSSEIANRATAEAARTDIVVRALAEGAQKIGDVVSLITNIASQTNLLALNATIEAARAGEAGKGFAVVASEVKGLAAQTTKATEEIGQQISQIQSATREAAQAIQGIATTIGEVSQTFTSIAAAIEEQGAATDEIARNVQQAARGTESVTDTIQGVSQGAAETGAAASQVLGASAALSKQAERLSTEVDLFIAGVKAA